MLENITIQSIDQLVVNGQALAILTKESGNVSIPQEVGDWHLRIVNGQDGEERSIVAVPSNSRTRSLYNAGRRVWLHELGYSEELANTYFHASAQIAHRWEEGVAKFVLAHQDMTDVVWYAIRDSVNPRKEAGLQGIETTLSQPRLNAALQILMNGWEHIRK